MSKKIFFVVREKRVWRYVPEFGRDLWVTASRCQITQSRRSEEEANNDFFRLGLKLQPGKLVQCDDNIIPGKSWVRHIVQCRTVC